MKITKKKKSYNRMIYINFLWGSTSFLGRIHTRELFRYTQNPFTIENHPVEILNWSYELWIEAAFLTRRLWLSMERKHYTIILNCLFGLGISLSNESLQEIRECNLRLVQEFLIGQQEDFNRNFSQDNASRRCYEL